MTNENGLIGPFVSNGIRALIYALNPNTKNVNGQNQTNIDMTDGNK